MPTIRTFAFLCGGSFAALLIVGWGGNILQASGVIRRKVVLCDPVKLNLGLTAFVAVRTIHHNDQWLRKFAAAVQSPGVEFRSRPTICAQITGSRSQSVVSHGESWIVARMSGRPRNKNSGWAHPMAQVPAGSYLDRSSQK